MLTTLTNPTGLSPDAPAGKTIGPNRYTPQPESTPASDRFAKLLQQRQNAQPVAKAPAPQKEPPSAPKTAAPKDAAPQEAAARNAERGDQAGTGADSASAAEGTAAGDAALQASTGCEASAASGIDGAPTLAPRFGRELPIADAPATASTDAATDDGAAADAAGQCELPFDLGKGRAAGKDAAVEADGDAPQAAQAPIAALPLWPGAPTAATPAHATSAPTQSDALAAAGSATDRRSASATSTPPAAALAIGQQASGNANASGQRGTTAGGGNEAGDDRAAALLAAAGAQAAQAAASTDATDKALATTAAGDRFALPQRVPPPLHASPGWIDAASGIAPRAADAGATTTATATLATPLQAPDFAKALGAQVSVFARNGLAQAELQLTPAEMGPIRVQIAIDGTQARVDFSADTAATRQVIERGLPELASALREQGLTLAGGGVFQRAPDQRGDTDEPAARVTRAGRARTGGSDDASATAGIAPAARARAVAAQRGGVDLYA